MGRKKKVRTRLKEIDFVRVAVLTALFGVIILAVLSPQTLEKIEEEYGFSISNYIDYKSDDTKVNANENKVNVVTENKDELKIEKDKLNIFYFDVGQADSTLIVHGDDTILIDAGNVSDGDELVKGIKGLGIKELDIVIGTHAHEDHLGGMNKIVDAFEIGKYYMPYNESSTTSYYKKLLTALAENDMGIEEAVVGDKILNNENLSLEILHVDNEEPEDVNDASIVALLEYKDLTYLFMGDSTKVVEEKRNWPDVDVLKVGHHGSNTSSSKDFIAAVKPEISIISVGKENSYGLPKDTIINRLKKAESNIYRTDRHGTIQLVSDGKENVIYEIPVEFNGSEDE